MAWWSRTQGLAAELKKSVPKGIWTKCERCSTTLYEADLDANFRVCTSCQHHFRMPTEGRIQLIVDDGQWQEHDRELESSDPLGFRVDGKKYIDQVKATARSNCRVIFSPTTEPIEPPINSNAKNPASTWMPPTAAVPAR